MSALPPIADIGWLERHVRLVPTADISRVARSPDPAYNYLLSWGCSHGAGAASPGRA